MRRLDRPYMNYNGSDDERRVALPRDGTWVKSTIDQIATTQNKLRVNVSQNQESIMMCRQESVVIAENVRSAATMCQQFGEKIMRLEDQIEYDRDSVDSISKQAKQTEAHFTNQYRQLLNKGIQVERNTARLEEEVLRLRQSNEQTNKKFQAINEKINDVMQQLSKQTNAMDVGIQDLRQLSHQTEMDAKKNIRTMVQEIDQKFDNEEQERRDDNSKMLARIDTIQGVVNDLKKMKQHETGNYVKLMEEKDHEYKEELKNFVKKIKSHVNENNVSTSPRDNRSVEDLSRKIREIEKKLVEEEKARTEDLRRLEDETAKHFKKVSGHIIEQLDKLGSSLTNNNLQDESTTKELKEMRKEIEGNKKAINRVLRAEITARKTQAQKFNDSIEGFQKHNTQTVQVVKEAIAEMKTYIDKELESKTDLRSDKVEHIIPKLDKRISNVEEKLTLQENDNKIPDSPEDMSNDVYLLLEERLSDLEDKLTNQKFDHEKEFKSARDGIDIELPILGKRMSDIEKRMTKHDFKLKEFQSTKEEIFSDLPNIEKRLSNVEKHVTKQDSKLKGFESTKEKVEIVIPRVERRLSATENKLTENTDNLKKLTSIDKASGNAILNIKERVANLEEALTEQELTCEEKSTSAFKKINDQARSFEEHWSEMDEKLRKQDRKFKRSDSPSQLIVDTNTPAIMENRLLEIEDRLTRQEKNQRSTTPSQHLLTLIPPLENRMLEMEKRQAKQERNKRSGSPFQHVLEMFPPLETRMEEFEKRLKNQEIIERSPSPSQRVFELISPLENRMLELERRFKNQQKFERSGSPTKHVLELFQNLETQILDLEKRMENQENIERPESASQHVLRDLRVIELEERLQKELDAKRSPAPDAVARELIPALDKKLSDLELKLERQILANQRSTSSIRTPSTPESDQDILQRLSILEGKLKWHMAVTVTRKAAEGDVIEERMEKPRRVRTAEVLRPQAKTDLPENRRHSSYITARMPMDNSRNSPDMKIATPPRKDRKNSYLQFSRERMFNIEKRLLRLSINQEKTDERVIRLKTRTKRELMIEKRLRNKLIEFINQRCLEGERIKLFVKQFGVHHIKYFIEYTGKKFLLNKWGIYQALRIYQLKKKWLALIGKEPAELTLKEYREIIREEIQKERERAKKEQKKKTVAPILPDFLSDTSESEPEPEPESEPEQEKEASVKGDSDLEPEKPEEKPKDGEPVRINYEDADSGDEYIQYKTDDDDYNESDDDFFPQSSEDDEDSKLFSDEDDDDDDETIEETEDEDAENEGENEDENEGEKEDDAENEAENEDDAKKEDENKDENEGEKEDNAENEADEDSKSNVGDEGNENDDENEHNENEDKSEADDDDDDDDDNTEDDGDETEDDNEDDDDNDDEDDDDDDNESNGEEEDEDEDAEGDDKDDDQENENNNENNGDKANGDNNDNKKGEGGASDVKNGQNNTASNS